MIYKGNDFGAFAFYHIPSGTMYELYSRDRYNQNLNIYATAWQITPGLTHAVQREDFDKLLVCDTPRRGTELEVATGEALNKLEQHVNAQC